MSLPNVGTNIHYSRYECVGIHVCYITVSDLSRIDENRRRMPLNDLRRNDLFQTVDLKPDK